MREIRTLRATWRGLETWCGSGLPGHTGAPALDPTDERGWETERCRMAQATAPILDSTVADLALQRGLERLRAGEHIEPIACREM